jgi:hypothetical protein
LVALSATDITVARISEAVALGHTTWDAPVTHPELRPA